MKTTTTTARQLLQISISIYYSRTAATVTKWATSAAQAQKYLVEAVNSAGWRMSDYEAVTQGSTAGSINRILAADSYYSFDLMDNGQLQKPRVIISITRTDNEPAELAAARTEAAEYDQRAAARQAAAQPAPAEAATPATDPSDTWQPIPRAEAPRAYVQRGEYGPGQWVKLAQYLTADQFHATHGREFIITDFENVPRILATEYGQRDSLFCYVTALYEMQPARREAFRAYVKNVDSAEEFDGLATTPAALIESFESAYIGYYGTAHGSPTDTEAVANFLEELAEDDEVYQELPARYKYVDFQRAALDAILNRLNYAEAGHVFSY